MKDETNVLYIKLDNINLNKKSFNEFSCTELDKIHEVNNKYNDMIVDIIDKLKKN